MTGPSRRERPIRVGVLLDYPEEGWTSMDLVGSMIVEHLAARHGDSIEATAITPLFRTRLARLGKRGRDADRMLNRHLDYSLIARRLAGFDLFHVVDHSYAHLVGALPPGRAVVTCHDLDAFRCLLEPANEPRPWWFRALAGRTVRGLGRSAFVVADSEATRRGLVEQGLVAEDRVETVHLGTHPECSPEADPAADSRAAGLLGVVQPERPELLHVGSNIPRKRVDVLLATFASVRRSISGARLVKVGGGFAGEHARRVEALGIGDSIVVLPPFSPTSAEDRATLAAVYRRAALVLQPSEAEGFGLPVAEAMACGTPVLASDIPVLRELGGEAVVYRSVGDVEAWAGAAAGMIGSPSGARRAEGLRRAGMFGWGAHVDRLAAIYRQVLSELGGR